MATTRKDIAEHCGISSSTVGMILSGRGERYSKVTRTRVLEAARRLNYRPHIHARGLRMNRSFLIGISFFAANDKILVDVLRGVQQTLANEDYSPLVYSCRDFDEQAQGLRRFCNRQVDGLILNAAYVGDGAEARYRELVPQELPVVEIFGRVLHGTPTVNVDLAAASREAVEHLIRQGHRRIAMLTHERYAVARHDEFGPHHDAWQRYVGYRDAMAGAGLKPIVLTHPITREVNSADEFFAGGEQSLDLILHHPAGPTAVVCYADEEACGLIREAHARGVKLPERLSIVGFSDGGMARAVTPALSTHAIPAFEVGRLAAAALLQRIQNNPVPNQLVQPRWVERQSTADLR